MATLTTQQLKDSYQSLVTIGDSITSDPTSGALENGKGTALTSFTIGDSHYIGSEPTFDNLLLQSSSGESINISSSNDIVLKTNAVNPSGTGTERMKINGSSGDISFRDGSANEAFYWDASAGSLGIGETSPLSTLEVSSGTANNIAHFKSTDSVGYIAISDNTTSPALGNYIASQGNEMFFATADTERMRITSDGYVGIGTGDTDVQSGDLIGVLAFNSKDISTNSSGAIGSIRSYATAAFNTGAVSGDLRFYTQNNGAPNGSLLSGTERMRILSGGGITFNGDTATANALNDYEEGTFTPTLKGASTAGTFTYSAQSGSYTKIGRQVTVNINLTTSGITVSPSGTAIIESLPFTSSAGYYAQGAGFVDNLGSDNRQTSFQVNPNSVRIVLVKDTGTTSAHGGLDISEFSGNERIRLTATYFV